MNSKSITWVVESSAFPDSYSAFTRAMRDLGHQVLEWQDEWWEQGGGPDLEGQVALFHGSLGNADRIARTLAWVPGSFCDTTAFECTSWYERARGWLLHREWVHTTVGALTKDPLGLVGHLARDGQVFVRPNSPLKPFSGRVCSLDRLTLEALDFGFYYDDPETPVVVAHTQQVGREWRFVVVNGRVVAGSGYVADGRIASRLESHASRQLADEIAARIAAPEPVYVLDVCEVAGELRLLELNPFSGADLYGCDPISTIDGVAGIALEIAGARVDT